MKTLLYFTPASIFSFFLTLALCLLIKIYFLTLILRHALKISPLSLSALSFSFYIYIFIFFWSSTAYNFVFITHLRLGIKNYPSESKNCAMNILSGVNEFWSMERNYFKKEKNARKDISKLLTFFAKHLRFNIDIKVN